MSLSNLSRSIIGYFLNKQSNYYLILFIQRIAQYAINVNFVKSEIQLHISKHKIVSQKTEVCEFSKIAL